MREQMWDILQEHVHRMVHTAEQDDKMNGFSATDQIKHTQTTMNRNKMEEKQNDKVVVGEERKPTNRHQIFQPDLLGDLKILHLSQPPRPAMIDRLHTVNQWTPTGTRLSLPARHNSTVRMDSNHHDHFISDFPQNHQKETFHCSVSPAPLHPMRNLKWIKIPDKVVELSRGCIWEPKEIFLRVEPDYFDLEQLFAETLVFRVGDEIPLLNDSTRRKINLFLNRLEVEPVELLHRLLQSDAPGLNLALLKYLHQILPSQAEMWMLREYSGSLTDLGMAEQFLFHLMDIPDYPTLIHGHLLRLEFKHEILYLQRALQAMGTACRFILNSDELRDLLHLVLRVGNFLNHGHFNGRARGIDLSSLPSLKEVHSPKLNHTLLHHIVSLVVDNSLGDQPLGNVLGEISKLEKAARYSPEEIKNAVIAMNEHFKIFVSQLTRTDPSIADIFQLFMEEVKYGFGDLKQSISQLRLLSDQVAEYLCEASSSFNLQICFQHILAFFQDIHQASQEITLFKCQHTRAERRSDQFKTELKLQRLTMEFGKEAKASSSILEERKGLLEQILVQLHQGQFADLQVCAGEKVPDPDDECSQAAIQIKAVKKVPSVMEISSIVSSSILNRPYSEDFDDDLFHNTPKLAVKDNIVTNSESPLQSKQIQEATYHYTNSRHQRSRSDLTDSVSTECKWLKYVSMKQQELSGPEISQAALSLQQFMPLPVGPTLFRPEGYEADGKRLKEEKRSSISNFFRRLHKAVSKSRSTTGMEHNFFRSSLKMKTNPINADGEDKKNDMALCDCN